MDFLSFTFVCVSDVIRIFHFQLLTFLESWIHPHFIYHSGLVSNKNLILKIFWSRKKCWVAKNFGQFLFVSTKFHKIGPGALHALPEVAFAKRS